MMVNAHAELGSEEGCGGEEKEPGRVARGRRPMGVNGPLVLFCCLFVRGTSCSHRIHSKFVLIRFICFVPRLVNRRLHILLASIVLAQRALHCILPEITTRPLRRVLGPCLLCRATTVTRTPTQSTRVALYSVPRHGR